ncbi:MAG: GNAT family N-acetyltransferase [Blastocatellia bacterium]|nr:GNAT family N-acetyltransferase [Blastocatellia bacterium]
MTTIKLAEADEEIARCFAVMRQLRDHLIEENFLPQIRRMQAEGYQLAYLEDAGEVKALGGFRIFEMLARGRFMYVDDLVTNAADRSKGYGDAMLDWLADYAKTHDCEYLNLDSGVHRFGAHRFYLRKRMDIVCHHFSLKL